MTLMQLVDEIRKHLDRARADELAYEADSLSEDLAQLLYEHKHAAESWEGAKRELCDKWRSWGRRLTRRSKR